MSKYRGGTTIHSQKYCSFFSFGSWTILDDRIEVRTIRTAIIEKTQIKEIRCKRRLTPELTIVYQTDSGTNLARLAVFRQKTKRQVQDILLELGYPLLEETRFEARGQHAKDIADFQLCEEA